MTRGISGEFVLGLFRAITRPMTKTENRLAARAHAAERDRERREAIHADAVRCDLAKIEDLRRYLITGWRSGSRPQALIDAIDDCAEQLTGDRAALHAKSSSIG